MKHIISSIIISLAGTLVAGAQALSLEQSKQAFATGDYGTAAPGLASAADAEPKNKNLNHMAGVAMMRSGQPDKAEEYLKRGTNESLLFLARMAVDEYEFDEAEELIDQFNESIKPKRRKGRKQTDEQEVKPEIYTEVEEALERGRSMIQRVEKIVVIDSIAVPRDEFFKAYRLAASAGKIGGTDLLPQGFPAARPTTVHVSPDGESMIWAATDSADNSIIAEATRLADGSWEGPYYPNGDLGEGGNVNYPFLMSDGVTLYFAADGESSLGGYDIYISRRDGEGFLQPQNLGLPYNSPYDDYMLAIDEETGTGWWATDRNQLGDNITIYRFIPSELRKNYPADTPDLIDKAKLTDYRSTWEPGADYAALIASPSADKSIGSKEAAFRFALPDGRILTQLSDIKNQRARTLLSDYLNLQASLQKQVEALEDMRSKYRSGERSMASKIIGAETKLESSRKEILRKRNEIVSAIMR